MIKHRYNNTIDVIKFSQYMRILEEELTKIKSKYKKIALYGAGTISNLIAPFLEKNLVVIVDKNKKKANSEICLPTELRNYHFDCIVITAIEYQEEIIEYLTKSLNINENKIVLLTQVNFSIDNTCSTQKLQTLNSGICTQEQLESEKYQQWIKICGEDTNKMHRKLWEFAFILESLNINKMLSPNKKGLGFAVGQEPLPSVMCSMGVEILATDLNFEDAQEKGWVDTNQHASNLEALNTKRLCDDQKFKKLCSYKNVNMNNIPNVLSNFDFLWSSCAVEHLGSIELGLKYIYDSLKCLKPGGIAVHTLEYNCSSNTDTITTGPTVLFRKQDIEKIIKTLQKDGHKVDEINFKDGTLPYDKYVDFPPYNLDHHLKLKIGKYVTTSIGIIIKKAL